MRGIRKGWFERRGVVTEQWKQIRQLPRFAEVLSRLKEGQSPDYVAQLIQQEMRELTDLSPIELSNLLRKYRAEVLGVVVVEETIAPDGLEQALKEKVDLYEQYAFLVNAQKWRIQQALQREGKGGMLAGLYRDLDVLRQTLHDFAQFQLETGMLRRQPVLLDATLKSQATSLSMSMLLTADAATRDQARAATQQLAKLLSEPAVDVDSSQVTNGELDDES